MAKKSFPQIFEDDVVVRKGSENQGDMDVGLVAKVGWDSDNDEEEEEEDEDSKCAHIRWLDLAETLEEAEDLSVIDRSFLHGDVVVEANKPEGQIGTVVGVNLLVDVKLLIDLETKKPEKFEDGKEIGRAVQQECRDRSRMPSSA
eukprot:TRINITY_DN34373_c0_g2_i2.p1 TRINITY_DN34373_c0_g2~~TRINITY_DN34373_c0_g2_i2.p1  ORF type:complete len:145 (-),score=36.39 TRINITY_DN34373_c0_g2_i2:11-445(-)